MTHLGVYFAPEHHRKEDRDYIAALQPPVIRLLDCDVQQIADMHALVPHAIIAPRTWVIDDNSGAAVRNLMADPIGTGRDHANQYRGQVERWQQEAQQRGLKIPGAHYMMFNAANEPNQGGTPDKIAAYNVAFLDRCTELHIRAAALCLGVGWPDNTGPDTPVNWQPYADAGLVQAIKRGQHWLELHEYHYKTGPQDGWRWLAGRHLQCPFDVPILLGEIGVDNYVDKPRWDKEGGNRGWQGNVSPDVYAEMIERHITHSDRRVVAALPFITDFRNREWQSFDTGPAHNALLARKDRMVPQSAPPTSTQPTNTPAYIIAPAGANLRTAPITGQVITAIPYAHEIRILGVMDTSGWLHVRYGNHEGYMAASLVALEPPKETEPGPVEPPSKPVGDNWERSIRWVLEKEGGFQDNPADKGNYYQGKLIGTKYGISAASWGGQYDIPTLAIEQAKSIYFEHYWRKSGADRLEWPLSLLVLDSAVLHGTGAAEAWLKEVGPNPYAFAAKRLRVYTKSDNGATFWRGWVNRVADLLEEISG